MTIFRYVRESARGQVFMVYVSWRINGTIFAWTYLKPYESRGLKMK